MKLSDLSSIIAAMEKHEKKFFRVLISDNGTRKKYVRLFDEINKNKKNIPENSYGAREASHLKQTLYRVLNHCGKGSEEENGLADMINTIRILYGKGLYGLCGKEIRRVKKHAYLLEKYTAVIELIELERKLIRKHDGGDPIGKHLQIIREKQEVLRKINRVEEMSLVQDELSLFVVGKGKSREDEESIEKIIKPYLLEDPARMPSIQEEYFLNRILFSYYNFRGEWNMAKLYGNRIVNLMESRPVPLHRSAEEYIANFHNLLNIYLRLRDFSGEFVSRLKDFSDIPEKYFKIRYVQPHIRKRFTAAYHQILLNYNLASFDRESLGKNLPVITNHLEKYASVLTPEEDLVFSINLSIGHFYIQKYKESLFWLQKILNDRIRKFRFDVYSFARIFHLLVQYELGNMDLLESLSQSAYRFMKTRNLFFKTEKVLYDFLNKEIHRCRNKEETRNAFCRLEMRLTALSVDPHEKIIFSNFDFIRWTRSKNPENLPLQ